MTILNNRHKQLKDIVLKTYNNVYSDTRDKYYSKFNINENNQFEGDGEIYYHGVYYKGYLVNGKRVGRGMLIKDGIVYCGYFKDDVPHGKMFCMVVEKLEYYVSEWKNGVMSGYGDFYQNDNLKYTGNIVDFDFNGYGTVYNQYGEPEFSGIWKDGIPLTFSAIPSDLELISGIL